jgi:hypothetical protein
MAELKVLPTKVEGISSLEQLQCAMQSPSWNDITTLKIKDVDLTTLEGPVVFGSNVRVAELKNCTLTVSPIFNEGLQEVRLDNNAGLTELSALPASLLKLYCRRTGLTHLPQLPEGLVTLGISNCALQDTAARPAIPNFPASLIYIDIQHNQVSRLPAIPPALRTLQVSHNQIQFIPTLPDTLERFFCNDNQLQTFPTFPATVHLDPRYLGNNPLVPPYAAALAAFQAELQAVFAAPFDGGYFDRIDQARQAFRTTIQQLNARQRGRNVAAAKQTLPQAGIPSTGAMNVIASFLTGKPGSAKQQALQLQEEASRAAGAAGVGGGRRHTRRKGRKAKRSSTR